MRRPGAGRRLTAHDRPWRKRAVDPVTRGDPMGPLLWTCSAGAVGDGTDGGRSAVSNAVNRLLHLQPAPTLACGPRRAQTHQPAGASVSVWGSHCGPIGHFATAVEWRRATRTVKVHDFIDRELGKAIPYGVYDVTRDSGWVSVGEDHDTPAFAGDAAEVLAPRAAYPAPSGCAATGVVPTAVAVGCGRRSCRSSRTRAGCASVSLSAGDASGTRSSTGCSPHRGELERAAVGESGGGGEFAHDDDRRIARSELDENSYPRTGERRGDGQAEPDEGQISPEWNYKLTPRIPDRLARHGTNRTPCRCIWTSR